MIFPTTLSGNTLDLFWSVDPQAFVVYRSEKTYSDRYPIFALLHVSGDDCYKPDVSKQMYSKKRFNIERFSCLLKPLYAKLYSNSQNDFFSTFDVSIEAALMIHALKRVKEDLLTLITTLLILFIQPINSDLCDGIMFQICPI